MNKLHTLQLYHEQVAYPNVSWTSYIPYSYIMNKLHTLQLYHEQLHTLQLYHEQVT